MKNSKTVPESDNGDFMASRQTMEPLEVWSIGGKMCIAQADDPIYITKEQAMKFFGLIDSQGDSK